MTLSALKPRKEAQSVMKRHEPMLVIRNRLRKFFHSTFWQIFSFFSYNEKKLFIFKFCDESDQKKSVLRERRKVSGGEIIFDRAWKNRFQVIFRNSVLVFTMENYQEMKTRKKNAFNGFVKE